MGDAIDISSSSSSSSEDANDLASAFYVSENIFSSRPSYDERMCLPVKRVAKSPPSSDLDESVRYPLAYLYEKVPAIQGLGELDASEECEWFYHMLASCATSLNFAKFDPRGEFDLEAIAPLAGTGKVSTRLLSHIARTEPAVEIQCSDEKSVYMDVSFLKGTIFDSECVLPHPTRTVYFVTSFISF